MFHKCKWLICALALSLTVGVASCDREEDDEPDTPSNPWTPGGGSGNQEKLSVTPTQLSFSGSGDTKSVYLSNVSGSVDVNKPSWISVSKRSSSEYAITASANTGGERTANVNFASNGFTVTVYVVQSAKSGGSGGNGGSGTDNQKPAVPTGLTATPDGPSTAPYAALRWNAVTGATQYIVYRSTSASGSYSQIKTTTSNSYNDQSVQYGKTYYYKVKASNSYGTSDYSNYAVCEFTDRRKPGPVEYGNCTVSGTTMTLRWSLPRDPSFGTPTKAVLRVYNPDKKDYVDLQTLSGTATSVSFTYTPWVDKEGYVRAGIILENENGSGGGLPKIYDTKNKRWMN